MTSHMMQQGNSLQSGTATHASVQTVEVHCREQLTRELPILIFAVQPLQLLAGSHQLLRLLLRLQPCQETLTSCSGSCFQGLRTLSLYGRSFEVDAWLSRTDLAPCTYVSTGGQRFACRLACWRLMCTSQKHRPVVIGQDLLQAVRAAT